MRENLKQMVEDGIAILKVGPALTFGLREALLALEQIETALFRGKNIWRSDFNGILEETMLEKPANWQKHYHGSVDAQRLARTYSFSDRARYYLPEAEVQASIGRLIRNLRTAEIPDTLFEPVFADAVWESAQRAAFQRSGSTDSGPYRRLY